MLDVHHLQRMKSFSKSILRYSNYNSIANQHGANFRKCTILQNNALVHRTFSHFRLWQQQPFFKYNHCMIKTPHPSHSSLTKNKRCFSSIKTKMSNFLTTLQTHNQGFAFYKSIFLSLFLRGIAMLSIMHVIQTYIFTINACEGPSMEPTMKSSGEIIIVERISHRLYGMEDGCTCSEREEHARRCQRKFEIEERKKRKIKKKNIDDSNKSDFEQPVWYQNAPSYKEKRKKKHVLWGKLTSGISNGKEH